MDQLRLNQVNLKKEESNAKDRDKRILQLDKQYQLLQQKLSLEVEAKQQAEQESRSSAQMGALLLRTQLTIAPNFFSKLILSNCRSNLDFMFELGGKQNSKIEIPSC